MMKKIDLETPGGRIYHLRKDILHLTMDKFAEPLGVGNTAISKVEKGQTNLSTQLLRSICREYNVREEWLKDGIGDLIENQPICKADIFAAAYFDTNEYTMAEIDHIKEFAAFLKASRK